MIIHERVNNGGHSLDGQRAERRKCPAVRPHLPIVRTCDMTRFTGRRLSEAELMAEFHSARADHAEASNHPSGMYWTPLDAEEDASADMALKRLTTFLRFASLPHFN